MATGGARRLLVADTTLEFLDHYLHDDAGALPLLVVRADAPGVAELDLER